MNEIAQWLGYGVMVVGGGMLVVYGLYVVWAGFCGLASGVVRSTRAIRAAREGVKRD